MAAIRTVLTVCSLVWVTACATAPPQVECARVETLASYPHGAFLENLIVERSGRVLYTNYTAREIASYTPGQVPSLFTSLRAHPVSLLPVSGGYLVAAHGASFAEGPAFLQSNQFILLDAQGAVTRTIPAPDARFLNGMVALEDGDVLVADSVLGRIWRLNVASGALTVWLDAPELAPDPTQRDQRPGANGLKREGRGLFVSNSFTGRIYRIGIGAQGQPSGALQEVAAPGRVDDFVLAPRGSFIAATHADTVVWTRGGDTRVVLPDGGDGSTAVAYTDDRQDHLYVLTTGNLIEGGTRPARLLQAALPGGPAQCALSVARQD
jgi:hypothetical protein